ncbi:MAG: hypothetical protein HUK21_11430, partial [Fibrobacteraceae bacterium]|nr:hypothetical protein [Fibrobacteraceae bacterium]
RNFRATINVSESADVGVNRTGMLCHYSVNGGDAETSWKPIRKKDGSTLLHSDSVTFEIDENVVGRENGKRYLTTVCLDAAGNASTRTDLFHLGERYPTISSPTEAEFHNNPVLAITGIAPPAKDGEMGVYRLRYRFDGETTWRTEGIEVVRSNQSAAAANISKSTQPEEGLLGYFARKNLEDTVVVIELGVSACAEGCKWVTDSVTITLGGFSPLLEYPTVVLLPENNSSMLIGRDTLDVSLRLDGKFDDSYHVRLYAEDAEGRAVFEKSMDGVTSNPFYGQPANTSFAKGVWFYELDGRYHLQWSGLPQNYSLKVVYNSPKFGKACLGANDMELENCHSEALAFPLGANDFGKALSAAGMAMGDYPELEYPFGTDSVMVITADKGHIVMESEAAFRVYAERDYLSSENADTLPVFFGENVESGFAWYPEEARGMDVFGQGWTMDPARYGIRYHWDGSASGSSYPAEGPMKIYSSIVEQDNANLYVHLDTIIVNISLPELEIALPSTLSDFVILKNDTAKTNCDTCERRVFSLDYKDIPYGIKYRDADVVMVVKNPRGEIVDTLVNTSLRAHRGDSAYLARWNGKNSLGTAETKAGAYTVEIVATDKNGKVKRKSAKFDVKYKDGIRDMTPEDPKNPKGSSIYVAEADRDPSGLYRYEPFADYLVSAKMSGWRLSDSARNRGITVGGTVGGTQEIIGYEPKRFSLGIRRHREQLPLVVVSRVHIFKERVDGDGRDIAWMWNDGCSQEGQSEMDIFEASLLIFSQKNLTQTTRVYAPAGGAYGYDDHHYDDNWFDIIVIPLNKYEQFFEDKLQNGDSLGIDSTVYNELKGVSVWRLENAKGKWFLPSLEKKMTVDSIVFNAMHKCSPKENDDHYLDSVCVYGPDGTSNTNMFDANANLFSKIKFKGAGESNTFYTALENINRNCGGGFERSRASLFSVELTIDTAYWNAPFGMDNLVNRTIRFDHTNKTVYGNDSNGYWSAYNGLDQSKKAGCAAQGTYFDGSEWKNEKNYGLLTPFEMQCLNMLPASVHSGGTNMFLFADEDPTHIYPSYFDLKFYGQSNVSDYFQVLALGVPLSPSELCEKNAAAHYEKAYQLAAGLDTSTARCQVSWNSLDTSFRRTPLFGHGYVDFLVARNKKWTFANHRDTIPYPATAEWRKSVSDSCSANTDYGKVVDGSGTCYKYYDAGSRIQYSVDDGFDARWASLMVNSDSILRNALNSPAVALAANYRGLPLVDPSRIGDSSISSNFEVALDSEKFVIWEDSGSRKGAFYVELDSLKKKIERSIPNVNLVMTDVEVGFAGSNKVSDGKDTLYVFADRWDSVQIYRRRDDTTSKLPVKPNTVTLQTEKLFANRDAWLKNVAVDSARLLYLDSSEHSHLEVSAQYPAAKEIYVGFKDSIAQKRVNEFVELRAHLQEGTVYSLAYLKDSSYYQLADSIAVDSTGDYRLQWFNVNKLQGNTQFLLTWGRRGSSDMYCSVFDLIVGSDVKANVARTVSSALDEVSVTFFENSLVEGRDVTVRVADASDYPFEEFNGAALTGPITEVLPHMVFGNETALPRIQMTVSRQEMADMGVTPQTLRLYKVDFENRKFVALTNALYGFLDKDGKALAKDECAILDEKNCPALNKQWAYMLISAETRTFSVFVALDSIRAEAPNYTVEVLPEIAATDVRSLRVEGLSYFDIYIDDDAMWNDSADGTPAVRKVLSKDSSGLLQVALLERDTTYIFVLPKTDDTTSSFVAPKMVRAIRV